MCAADSRAEPSRSTGRVRYPAAQQFTSIPTWNRVDEVNKDQELSFNMITAWLKITAVFLVLCSRPAAALPAYAGATAYRCVDNCPACFA